MPSDRLRAPGAGDKPAIDKQPGLAEALDELVHPDTRGTPMSALRWTLQSTYELARDLQAKGFSISADLVQRMLYAMGYSFQTPSKQNEGTARPDRGGQFRHINALASEQLSAGKPAISVDQEEGADRQLRQRRQRVAALWRAPADELHDFADRTLGRSPRPSPMGYMTTWATTRVGSASATPPTPSSSPWESIRRWWRILGKGRFPDPRA